MLSALLGVFIILVVVMLPIWAVAKLLFSEPLK
jgi:hypothetical protein